MRTLIARDFTEAFEKVDAILTPTTPSPAFGITEEPSGVEMYMNDVFTVPASMAGIPGISLPAGLSSDGLPLGLQLLGRAFDEVGLLRGRTGRRRGWLYRRAAVHGLGETDDMAQTIKGQTGEWEIVIGMEVHAQVLSQIKLFSGRLDHFRQGAQHQRRAGRCRAAGHAARAE